MMLKKALKRLSQNRLLIPLLTLLALVVFARFVWLGRFPSGIDHDELEVVLSAKTYWNYGRDISGVSFPASLFGNNTEAGLAGLPSVILAPLFGPFPLSLALVRFPYILLSLLSIALLAKLVYDLTSNKVFSWAVLGVGLINPWFFAFSRESTESSFALFFILLGIYLLFKKKKQLVFSALSFTAAFYSYFGAKPLLVLMVPFLFLTSYLFDSKRNRLNKYIISLLLFFAAAGFYFVLAFGISSSQTIERRIGKEIEFLKTDFYSKDVREMRRASIDYPLKSLVYNKGTVTALKIAEKYAGWLSSDFLFFGGDPRAMYRFENHGMFYVFDFIMVFSGLLGFLKVKSQKRKKELLALLSLFFVLAPLPSSINAYGDSYYFRGFLLMPFLIVVVAAGFTFLYESLPKKAKPAFLFFGPLIYFVLFLNFLAFYFFRYPVKQHSNNYLDGRVLANYVIRSSQEGGEVAVITTSAYYAQNALQFYSQNFGGEVKPLQMKDVYKKDGIVISEECEDFNEKITAVVDTRLNCEFETSQEPLLIQDQKDAGTLFDIYNDGLCKGVELSPWRRNHLVTDYSIEELSNKEFCNRWLAN